MWQRFDVDKEVVISCRLYTKHKLCVKAFAVGKSGKAVIITVGCEISAEINGYRRVQTGAHGLQGGLLDHRALYTERGREARTCGSQKAQIRGRSLTLGIIQRRELKNMEAQPGD